MRQEPVRPEGAMGRELAAVEGPLEEASLGDDALVENGVRGFPPGKCHDPWSVRRGPGVEAQLAPPVRFPGVVDGDLLALLDLAYRRVGEGLGLEIVLGARRRRP